MRTGCGTLAATVLSGCLTADNRPVTFGLVTDVHYADIDNAIGRHYREAEARLAACVREMNARKPDFLIELGDFKDLGPSPAATLDGLRRIERTFAGFEGARYHVLGNHDCDALTPDEFLANIANFGQPQAKAYYGFRIRAITFLVLDGCYTSDMRHYSRSNPWTDANIPPDQFDWLRQELERADGPVIVFCHQRMDPASEPHHLLKNAAQVREVLERSGKVRTVITGHQHTGGYCKLNGISNLTLLSVVDGEDTNAYALAAVEKLLNVTDMWLPDFKADDDATHQKYTGVSNKIIKKNLERLVAAKAKLEVRCLVVPGCTDDMPARYAYLDSIGISRKDVVELEYFDYARSKYQALGLKDTMPPKPSS